MNLQQQAERDQRREEIIEDLRELVDDMNRAGERLMKVGVETARSKLDRFALEGCTRVGDRHRTAELLRVASSHVENLIDQIEGAND